MEASCARALTKPPQKSAFWHSTSRLVQIQEPETRSQALPLLDTFAKAAFDVSASTPKPHSRSVCDLGFPPAS